VGLFTGIGGIDTGRAVELLASGEAVALDVRERYEWEAGHIGSALHIPLGELTVRREELPRSKKIVAVCRTGSRSGAATQALRRAGCEVENLSGGLVAWVRAGLPLDPPDGSVI